MNSVPVKLASINGRILAVVNFSSIPPVGSYLKILEKDKILIAEVEKYEYLVKPSGVSDIKIIVKELAEIVNNNLQINVGDFIEFKVYSEQHFGQVIQFPEYKYLVCIGFRYKEPLPQFFFIKHLVREDLRIISKERYYELLLSHSIEVRKLVSKTKDNIKSKLLTFEGILHDLCPLTNQPISKVKCANCNFNIGIEENDPPHRLRFRVYCGR